MWTKVKQNLVLFTPLAFYPAIAYTSDSGKSRFGGKQMIFESHAHYDDEAFDEDRETLLASMQEKWN